MSYLLKLQEIIHIISQKIDLLPKHTNPFMIIAVCPLKKWWWKINHNILVRVLFNYSENLHLTVLETTCHYPSQISTFCVCVSWKSSHKSMFYREIQSHISTCISLSLHHYRWYRQYVGLPKTFTATVCVCVYKKQAKFINYIGNKNA